MAIRVPLIAGKVVEVRFKCTEAYYSILEILALIRRISGLPPFKVRRPSTEREFFYRNLAVYLAVSYGSSNNKYIANYFDVTAPYVFQIARTPFRYINLLILERYQNLIESALSESIAYSLEFDRPLYIEDVPNLEDAGQGFFTPTKWVLSPKEDELTTALFGLQEDYEHWGEVFDLDNFWNQNEEYDQWNLCPYNP